jgi:hypothetical protein
MATAQRSLPNRAVIDAPSPAYPILDGRAAEAAQGAPPYEAFLDAAKTRS